MNETDKSTDSDKKLMKAVLKGIAATMSGDDAELFDSAAAMPGIGQLLPQMCVVLAGVVQSAAQVMALRSCSAVAKGEVKCRCDHMTYTAIEVFDSQLRRFNALLGVVEAATSGDPEKAVAEAHAEFVKCSDASNDVLERVVKEAAAINRACGIGDVGSAE